jgi:hypothetical protein
MYARNSRTASAVKISALAAMLIVPIASCFAAERDGRAVRPPSPATRIRFQDLEIEPAPPGERYYTLIFGSQSTPLRPRYTHTWVTVVRVSDQGPGKPPQIEPLTISWMPATLDIHPMRFRVECGVNLDLQQSLENAVAHQERISMWGPFEMRTGVYRKFLIQREFMMSGRVGYQCIDSIGEAARMGNGCDCIHALTDMDSMFGRREYPLTKFGDKASENIVKVIMQRDILINPAQTHDWLMPVLGLDCYHIVRRCVNTDHVVTQQTPLAPR